MNLGGMGQMMGAVPGGFQQGQIANNQIDQQHLQLIDTRAKQAGMEAYFRALHGMMTPGGQGPQPPMPGQPSMPQQGSAPQMSPQAMPGPHMQSPMAMNNGQPVLASDGGIMPPMQSAPASGVQPAGPPGVQQSPPVQAPGGQQQMSWQFVATQLKQQNPGVDDLALAHAVDKFVPMMNQQSKLEWQQLRNEVLRDVASIRGGAQVEAAGTRADAQVQSAGIRADATDNRTEAQREAEKNKGARFDTAEGRRERALTQRDEQFQQREQRLQDSLKLRGDQGWARLQQQKEQAQQRVQQGDRRQAVVEWRAAIDAQHKMAMERIQTMNMNVAGSVKDKQALVKEQDAWYKAEIEKLKSMATQRGNTTDDGPIIGKSVEDKPVVAPAAKPKAAADAPAVVSPPAAPTGGEQTMPAGPFADKPDGTRLQRGSEVWVKRGDQLVLENGN